MVAENTAGERRGNQSEKFPKGGTSLAVQRLKLRTFTLGGLGSVLLAGEARIPHAVWHGQKVEKKKKSGEIPGPHKGKELTCQGRRCKGLLVHPWVGKIPWRWKWQPTPVFLPGGSHGQEGPGGLQSMGLQESDTTE